MSIHPDILVHWTPRKWAGQPLSEPRRREFVDLLKSIYTKGLLFTRPSKGEQVVGFETCTILPQLPILCFTELRLSQVERHIKRYGNLGIGFRRQYLLSRGANPVFYIQSAPHGIVNTNLKCLERRLKDTPELRVFMAYIKPMSSSPAGELDFYDEMEWRIVAAHLPTKRVFALCDGRDSLDFNPSDVELLVFPDAETRRLAMSDVKMAELFARSHPMMLDAPDVEHL
ncbi:MAG: abortive infection system antitoxin AbiGi family protein [Verrucomicrobiia bacterium]